MEPSQLAHNAANTECFALQARLTVLRKIPRVRNTPSLSIQGKAFIITLARRRHPVSPIFADDRNPITGEINRRDSFRCLWGTSLAAALRKCRGACQKKDAKEQQSPIGRSINSGQGWNLF